MEPVIICGMHRSGTSLISRSLEAIGLFTGHEKEHNAEAVFFLAINQWIFEQLGAGWDNTYNMRFLNDDLGGYIHAVINNAINGPSASTYTGTDQQYAAVFSPQCRIPWGWKDPRNTFTAPVWTSLFPDAKIIHVCRNPLDVAHSLRQREHEIMARHQAQLAQMTAEQLDGTMRFQQSPRMFHLTEGISLWEEYLRQALVLEQQFGDRALRVRYEDFISEPSGELQRIAAFCELDPDESQLQTAVSQIRPERRCAFLQDETLLPVYCEYRHTRLMKTLGYDRLHEAGECSSAA